MLVQGVFGQVEQVLASFTHLEYLDLMPSKGAKKVSIKKEKAVPCLAAAPAAASSSDQPVGVDINKFNYRMRSAPKHIKNFYENKLKFTKTSKCQEKQRFMEEVLTGDWNSEFFKRSETFTQTNYNISSGQWSSYKQVVDAHGVLLVQAMVAQGKMQTRDHDMLIADDPVTLMLPPEERLQYMEKTEVDQNIDQHAQNITRGSESMPDIDTADDEDLDTNMILKQVKGSRARFNAALISIKIKMSQLEANMFSGII